MNKTIKGVIAIIIAFASLNTAGLNIDAISGNVVNIPDANLKQCINAELSQQATDNITVEQMESILILECDMKDIDSIVGLEHMTNLTYLVLSRNNISDISMLSNLTEVETLDLSSNNISDINALSNMTKMGDLKLSNNNISDINALSNMTTMYSLCLDDNNVVDISALGNVVSLSYVIMGYNHISDISALSNLTNLNVLYMTSNHITNINALSNLTNLYSVSVTDQTSSLSPTNVNSRDYQIPECVIGLDGTVIPYEDQSAYSLPIDQTVNIGKSWDIDIMANGKFSGTIYQKVTQNNLDLPTITGGTITIKKGTTLSDQEIITKSGATASDNQDNNITNRIIVSNRGSLDIATVGTYTVDISVTDDYDQTVFAEVTVNVYEDDPDKEDELVATGNSTLISYTLAVLLSMLYVKRRFRNKKEKSKYLN